MGGKALGRKSENTMLLPFPEKIQTPGNYIKLQGKQKIPVLLICLFSICANATIHTHISYCTPRWSVITAASIRTQRVFSHLSLVLLPHPTLFVFKITKRLAFCYRLQLWIWLEWQGNEKRAEEWEEWWLVWLCAFVRSGQVVSIFGR